MITDGADINRYGMVLPPPKMSWADVLASLPKREKDAFFARLSEEELAEWGRQGWLFIARREQLPPPGDWRVWFLVAGRGAGKTRGMLEMLWRWHQYYGKRNTALGGRTYDDMLRTLIHPIISGDVVPKDFRPQYVKSDNVLVWPNNTRTWLISGDSKESGRGGNYDGMVLDEFAAWHGGRSDDIAETWHNLTAAVRIGQPEIIIGTTWRRGVPVLHEVAADPATCVTTMDTLDNRKNLPKSYVDYIRRSLHTDWGKQEFIGRVPTEDNVNEWWTPELLESCRAEPLNEYQRIIVAVDPSVTGTRKADETGIIILGYASEERVDVLDDMSVGGGPDAWVPRVVDAHEKWGADYVVAEANQGGDLVERAITDKAPNIKVKLVKASASKSARAEPILRLYSHGFVKHAGKFEVLEAQMLGFSESVKKSPDRLDALVWGVTDLMLGPRRRIRVWDVMPGTREFEKKMHTVRALGG